VFFEEAPNNHSQTSLEMEPGSRRKPGRQHTWRWSTEAEAKALGFSCSLRRAWLVKILNWVQRFKYFSRVFLIQSLTFVSYNSLNLSARGRPTKLSGRVTVNEWHFCYHNWYHVRWKCQVAFWHESLGTMPCLLTFPWLSRDIMGWVDYI
jgi:hypothetical protein